MDLGKVFSTIHSELASDKAKDRKEGLKKLANALDSEQVLAELDRKTLRLKASDSLTADTWPGLANILAGYTLKEVEQSRSKKRGPEAGISKVFRKFIQCAEDVRRSGRACMLQRWAGKVFAHVCKVIKLASLDSQIGTDYSTVLRTQLLPVPQYCAAATSITFAELLSVYMDKLEAKLDRSEDTFRAVGTLQLLLQHFPSDMDPKFQQDTVAHFRLVFQQLNELREDSRICVAYVTAVNIFLLGNGLDIVSKLRELHMAMHPFIVRVWGKARDVKLREALVAYLRIQLRLGAIQEMGSTMTALQELVENELLSGFTLMDESRGGKPGMSRQQRAFLDLAGAVLMQNTLRSKPPQRSSGDSPSAGEDSPPSAKKRRVESPVAVLLERALQSPGLWAAPLAVGLQQVGAGVPPHVFLESLDALATALQSGPASPLAVSAPLVDEACDVKAVATLHLIGHLAKAWPESLILPGSAAGKASQVDSTNIAQKWQAVCDAVLKWLQATNSSAECQDEGLQTLERIARRDLCPSLTQRPLLWDLPALKATPLTQAGLQLIACLFKDGSGNSAEELTQCQQLLQRVLPADCAWQPPASTAAAVLALMKAQGIPTIAAAVSLEQHSCWDSFNTPFEHALQSLVRGVEFAKQKAAEHAKRHAPDSKSLLQALSLVPPSTLQQAAGQALVRLLQATVFTVPDALALHQLLGGCAAAAACLASVQDVHERAGQLLGMGEVPLLDPIWRFDGSLAGALEHALKRCAALLVALCGNAEVIPAADLQQLRVLLLALQRIASLGGSPIVSSGLEGLVSKLEQIFCEAEASEAARAAAAADMDDDASQSNMFDDDLDMGGRAPAPGRPGRPASATVQPAGFVRQSQAVQLLRHLGVVQPTAAAEALLRLYEHCEPLEDAEPDRIQPPAELMTELIDALGPVVAGGKPPMGVQGTEGGPLSTAGSQRSASLGVGGAPHLTGALLDYLCTPRFMAGYRASNLLVVTRILQALAESLCATWAGGSSDRPQHVHDAIEGIASVLDHILSGIRQRQNTTQTTATTGQLRVQLAATIMALAALKSKLLLGEMLQDCMELVVCLLQDDRYQARLAAAGLTPQVLGTWPNVEHIFGELLGRLSLKSLEPQLNDNEEEHMETSVIILGEMGLASASVELRAIFHLCSHAAHFRQQMPLVHAVLEAMAIRSGYRCLPDYMAFHFRALMFLWYNEGLTLELLLGIQGLVATKEEHLGGEPKGFLVATTKELVPVMLLDQRLQELQQIADLIGWTLRKLLEQSFYSIMGAFYPYVTTGDEEDKQMVKKVTQEGIMATQFQGEEIDSMLATHIVNIFGAMLLTAGPTDHPARPFFPVSTVLASIRKIVNSTNPDNGDPYLWNNILAGDGIPRLLLVVHSGAGK